MTFKAELHPLQHISSMSLTQRAMCLITMVGDHPAATSEQALQIPRPSHAGK